MIFSLMQWNNASEIRAYISVTVSTQFQTLEAPLRNAFENYIRPLLGDDLTAELIAIYASDSRSDEEARLLQLAQAANAFLAFWSDYDEMQLMIDDSGTHRQESDTQKTPYKYQEQRLRENWRNKGFNALDKLLEYLETNIESFEDFLTSPNYTVSKTEIVRSTAEVNRYYWISNSRIIFLRLKPHFKTITDTIIAPRLGTVYTDMLAAFAGTDPVDEKYITLREKLIPVVVFYAVSRLLKETGSLTERGLFFETLQHSADDYNSNPVNPDQVAPQAAMAEGDAISYWTIAEKYLKSEFEYTATTKKLPTFNNTDKKSFWT